MPSKVISQDFIFQVSILNTLVLTQHLDVNLYRTKFLLSIICAKEMLQSMIRVIEVREPVLILFDDVSIDIIRPTFQYVGMCITASFMFILRIFLNTFIWLTGSVAVAFLYYKSITKLLFTQFLSLEEKTCLLSCLNEIRHEKSS